MRNSRIPKMDSTGIFIGFMTLVSFPAITTGSGLQCYQCLSLKCDSPTICDSIRASTTRKFFPRPPNIEFNPNDPCPDPELAAQNSTKWTRLSRECSKSDSVCLEATVEILTRFSGLKDSLQLESPFSSMKSTGMLRACASRRFIKNRTGETYEIMMDTVNDTLGPIILANSQSSNPVKDRYTVTGIDQHHFYIDHATADSVQCYDDNCNLSKQESSAVKCFSCIFLNILSITLLSLTNLINRISCF